MITTKVKGLTAAIMQEWKAEASKSEGTYVPDNAVKPLIVEDYSIRELKTRFGDTKKVSFHVEGQEAPFEFFIKGNRDIDTEASVRIVKFVAQKDYECTGGQIVKQGTVKWMAAQ